MADMTNLETLIDTYDNLKESYQSNEASLPAIDYTIDEKTLLQQKKRLIQDLRNFTNEDIRADSHFMTITLTPRRPENNGNKPTPEDIVFAEGRKLMTKLNKAALGNRVTATSHKHGLIRAWLFLEYNDTRDNLNQHETGHLHGFMIIPKVSIAKFNEWLKSEDDYQRSLYNQYLMTLDLPEHQRPTHEDLSAAGLLRNGSPFEMPEFLHQVPSFYRKKAKREFSSIGITEWTSRRSTWLGYITKRNVYHGLEITG